MNKKKNMWEIVTIIAIVIGNIAIMYGRSNSDYKIALSLILFGLSIIIIPFIYIFVKQRIILKMYGEEEIIKIQNIIIRKRNIDKYIKILSNDKADNNCDEETLIKNFTIKISEKTKTEELLKNINELLGKIGYNLHISGEDILKKDYEFIKIRRTKGYSTLSHDTNVIINILNNYNLEAINIVNNYESDKNVTINILNNCNLTAKNTVNSNKGDIKMGIVSFDRLEELNELGEYNENIEE